MADVKPLKLVNETPEQRKAALAQNADAWAFPKPIDSLEWDESRATPDCIVQDYLYADVGVMVAAGGIGKTTLALYEAVHIVLGLTLWGLEIKRPGPVMFISAEDSREILVARLREIAASLKLTDEQIRILRHDILISDVSATPIKLTAVIEDVVRTNHVVDEIIDACRERPPVLIIIDPAVSFGVGENRVNDAEQGLIEAARRMRNALNCCVRYIHHTGKVNAREKTMDQYSGRGGSALPDGCRMVAVMQPCDEKEWLDTTGTNFHAGESGLILARPKISYAPRPPNHFYIVRRGYLFQLVDIPAANPEAAMESRANQIWQFILNESKKGTAHNRESLGSMQPLLNMTRQQIRDATDQLVANGRVIVASQNQPGKKGQPAKYLQAVDLLNTSPE